MWVLNSVGATLLLPNMDWSGTNATLINRGLVAVGSLIPSSRVIDWIIDSENTMGFLSLNSAVGQSVTFNQLPRRLGTVFAYFVNLEFDGQKSTHSVNYTGSSLRMFGLPLPEPGATAISEPDISNYQSYVNTLNSMMNVRFRVDNAITLVIRNTYNYVFDLPSVTTRGFVSVRYAASRAMSAALSITQDQAGTVILETPSSGQSQLSLVGTRIGLLVVHDRWTISASSRTTFYNRLHLRGNCTLSVVFRADEIHPSFYTLPVTFVSTLAVLTLVGDIPTIVFRSLDLHGRVRFTPLSANRVVHVNESLRIQGGHISSSMLASMHIHGYSNITGERVNVVENIDLIMDRPHIPRHGVLAQYFQYRVPTPSMPASRFLQYFPTSSGKLTNGFLPENFNNLSTSPTFQRTELDISPQDIPEGHYPTVYHSDGTVEVSYLSFVNRFAVRLLTDLFIERAGLYQFYIRAQVNTARLWIDGVIVSSGSEVPANSERHVPVNLTVGLHRVRLDVLRSYTYILTDVVRLRWSGPGIAKRDIPCHLMYVTNPIEGSTGSLSSLVASTPQFSQLSKTLVMQGGSSIIVESSRKLELVGNFQWFSTYQQRLSRLVNRGMLSQTGGFQSKIFAVFQNSGTTENVSEAVSFRDTTQEDGVSIWTNLRGGLWTDASNWSPRQVPGSRSTVLINTPGVFQVIIPTNVHVQVQNLQVGSLLSKSHLIVNSLSTLNISDTLRIYSDEFTVAGSVYADTIVWSGQTIQGTSLSISQGTITAGKLFSVVRSPANSQSTLLVLNLNTITLVSLGSLHIPLPGGNGFQQLVCRNCEIINRGEMIVHTQSINFGSGSALASTSRLINEGNLTIENSIFSPRIDVLLINSGDLTLTSATFSRIAVFTISTLINTGTISTYMSTVHFGRVRAGQRPGTYRFWCLPLLYNHRVTPAASRDLGSSVALRSFVYREPIFWDTNTVCRVSFSNFEHVDLFISGLETKGRVEVIFAPTNNVMEVSQYVDLHIASSLLFSSHATTGGVFTIGRSVRTAVALGTVVVNAGWHVRHLSTEGLRAQRRFVLKSGANLTIASGGGAVAFENEFTALSGSNVDISKRQVAFQKVTLRGSMSLSRSEATANERLDWASGAVTGAGGSLNLRRGCEISSSADKTLDRVTLSLSSGSESPSLQGVIAEYFQYRVLNPLNPVLTSLYFCSALCSTCTGCVQQRNTSMPDIVRLEADISRYAVSTLEGHAPADYNTDGTSINLTSPGTFTHRYGVRWSTFLSIDQAGNYTLYFTALQRTTRLWVNGRIVWAGPRVYSSFQRQTTPILFLPAGLNLVQVDTIVHNQENRGSIFLIEYDGPNLSRRLIPKEKLFYGERTSEGVRFASRHWQSDQLSVCTAGNDGPLLLNNMAVVNITSSGVLELSENTRWVSSSSPSQSLVINAGTVRAVSGNSSAEATISGILQNEGGSVIGNVRFVNNTRGSAVLWNNPSGGYWLDASNWLPARVPGEQDSAFITLPGTYEVLLAGRSVTVKNLEVSGSATLSIERLSLLNVTDTWRHKANTLKLKSSAGAGTLVWSGETITSSSRKISVTVEQRLEISSSAKATLRNFTILLRGEANLGRGQDLICAQCRLVISQNARCLITGRDFETSVANEPLSTQSIVNFGTLVLASDPSRGSFNFHSNVQNFGTIYMVSTALTTNIWAYLGAGQWINHGLIRFHGLNVRLLNGLTMPGPRTYNGSWELWGVPHRFGQAIIGLNDPSRWAEFIASAYNRTAYALTGFSNPEIQWTQRQLAFDIGSSFLGNSAAMEFNFGSLKTEGFWLIRARTNSFITIHQSLHFSADTVVLLNLQFGFPSRLTFMPDSQVVMGTLLAANNDWIISLGDRCNFTALRNVVVNCRFQSSYSSVYFRDDVLIGSSGVAVLTTSTVKASAQLTVAGTLTLDRSRASLLGPLNWTAGTINGSSDSLMSLQKGGSMSSGVTLSSVQISLEGQLRSENRGVIAEYFQHNYDTSTTTYLFDIRHFPLGGSASRSLPATFDDPNTVPNFIRVENSPNRPTAYNGYGPLKYNELGNLVEDVDTFRFNFAVRFSTFLFVPQGGFYQFYFSTLIYGKPVRLWVNDVVVWSGTVNFYPRNSTATARLQKGFNKLRLDMIQRSIDWNSLGSALLVTYSGPCTTLRTLDEHLFTRAMWNGTLQYAAPTYTGFEDTKGVCNGLSVTDLCSFDEGVSCLRLSAGLSAPRIPFLYVSPTGVLDHQGPTGQGGNLRERVRLLVAGAVGRSQGVSGNLNTVYRINGGCLLPSGSGEFTLGTLDGKCKPKLCIHYN